MLLQSETRVISKRSRFFPTLQTATLVLSLGLVVFAAAQSHADNNNEEAVPAITETGDESARFIEDLPQDERSFSASSIYEVDQDTNLWYLAGGVLRLRVEIPVGTQIAIPKNYEFSILNYKSSSGRIERFTTGVVSPIRIVKIPASRAGEFPQSKIDKINSSSGGLFVTAAIVGRVGGIKGEFPQIHPASQGSGYRKYFSSTGKPLFTMHDRLKRRFGNRLNDYIDPQSQSAETREKWSRILRELRSASDRTIPAPKGVIMIPLDQAKRDSLAFEKKGIIPYVGAWTIATMATAVRHGFSDRPCAETMSEFIREAYRRAGYDVNQDFSASRGNRLFWSETASVEGLTRSMVAAGWIPWEMAVHRPPAGAIMMNGIGQTPGHTYISAGDGGRLIVDNGAPQGRDLRATKARVIGDMYYTGVFFLPPGIIPAKW